MSVLEQGHQQSDMELENAVENLNKQIEDAQVDLAEWRAQGTDSNDALEQLREAHSRACTALAQAKGSADEPGKLDDRMRVVRARLTGIENVISERQVALEGLKAEIAQLHGEQSRRAQQRELVREKEQTDALLDEAERLLAVRDNAARRFVEALIQLRSTNYRGQMARSAAFDGAQRLERISNGMRP
jgi:chromosome segregation ATPase